MIVPQPLMPMTLAGDGKKLQGFPRVFGTNTNLIRGVDLLARSNTSTTTTTEPMPHPRTRTRTRVIRPGTRRIAHRLVISWKRRVRVQVVSPLALALVEFLGLCNSNSLGRVRSKKHLPVALRFHLNLTFAPSTYFTHIVQ